MRVVLLAVLLCLPMVPALQAGLDGYVYGARVDVPTDAAGGRLSLHAPSPSGECPVHRYTVPTPTDGVLRGVDLDAAGRWLVRHHADDGSLLGEDSLDVNAGPLGIRITPLASGVVDHEIRVHRDGTVVPHAWVALRFQGAPVGQPLRTDADGRVLIGAADLPYAGTYSVAAYKDLDPDVNGALTEYPRHIVHPFVLECLELGHVDAPELYGVAGTITRPEDSLGLFVMEGGVQVRGVAGRSLLHTDGVASDVRLLVDGTEHDAAALGLSMSVGEQGIALEGTWNATANIVVEATRDANDDGRAEARGMAQIVVRDDVPIRVDVIGEAASYMVPGPEDGVPGRLELRFQIVATDTGARATDQDALISVQGDVLGSPLVSADNTTWSVQATPLGGGSNILIDIAWPGTGNATIVFEVPPEAGARSRLTMPEAVDVSTDEIRIHAQVFNWHQCQQGLCTGEACFDGAQQAIVELRWTDTGAAVHNRFGEAARYDPRPLEDVHCQCYQDNGEYVFYDLQLNRSGTLAAIVQVKANDGEALWSYTHIPVRPDAILFPSAQPSIAMAGEHTIYELRGGGLVAANQDRYVLRVLNASGVDVIDQGRLGSRDGAVTWGAALPAGEYRLVVEDRLEPDEGLWGLRGTKEPARIGVEPARVTFAAANETPTGDAIVLGGGLADAVQFRIEVRDPLGRPVPGELRIAPADGIGGLFAFSQANEPPVVGAPHVFAPNEAHWVNQEGRSYYVPELAQDRSFAPSLNVSYHGQPVLIYAWGTALGEATTTFRSGSSTQNQPEPAGGAVHFVPPRIDVLNVTTRHGTTDALLAVGETNLVRARVIDPSGRTDLAGYEFGLTPGLFGPSQRPGAAAQRVDGETRVTVAVMPDATGRLSWYAANPPSLFATGDTVNVTGADMVPYERLPGRVFVEMPSSVDAGAFFEIRVATADEAFPQGVTVEVFGEQHTLISGSARLQAPLVGEDTDHPVILHVPGHADVRLVLAVEALPGGLPSLGLGHVPSSIGEGAALDVFVHIEGVPVANATVEFGDAINRTDAQGVARIVAGRVDADEQVQLRVSHPASRPVESLVTVLDVMRPRLVITAQASVAGGDVLHINVTALDESGHAMLVSDDVAVTVETRRYAGALVAFTAPRLIEDTPVYVFAHAPGFDSARQLVVILAVAP